MVMIEWPQNHRKTIESNYQWAESIKWKWLAQKNNIYFQCGNSLDGIVGLYYVSGCIDLLCVDRYVMCGGIYYQLYSRLGLLHWTNGPWPLKIIEANGWMTPKPSKNHWNQWSGGWKSFHGDGRVTQKPSENYWKQWSVGWKTLNGNG